MNHESLLFMAEQQPKFTLDIDGEERTVQVLGMVGYDLTLHDQVLGEITVYAGDLESCESEEDLQERVQEIIREIIEDQEEERGRRGSR